ncbi:hypothetical protein ACQCRO_27780, partial [Ralstonia pseudosolanacearum]
MTDPKTFAAPASRTPPATPPRAAEDTQQPAAAQTPTQAPPAAAPHARPEAQWSAAAFTPAICYLHPLQQGPLDQWGGLLDRIAALGFDHVLIA